MKQMNSPNTQLKDLISIEKGVVPGSLCDFIVNDIAQREWKPHTWYSNTLDTAFSEETMEPDVQDITPDLQKLLTPFMVRARAFYSMKHCFKCERTLQIV